MSDNKNMKQCKSCEKEVSKSAKLCPHCGKKLKMGWFLKVVIGLVAIAVISSITSPSLEEHLTKTSEAQVIKVSPRGELADLFSLMNAINLVYIHFVQIYEANNMDLLQYNVLLLNQV